MPPPFRVEVKTRETHPRLFASLETNSSKSKFLTQAKKLCSTAIDFQYDPERVGYLSEEATHIIAVYDGEDRLMTFGYLNDSPMDDASKLILLCGRYKTPGPYPWKGSELVMDKAIQLTKAAGKKAIRLEALNEALLEKVYRPMGFKDLPDQYLEAELRPLPASGGLRLNVQRRRTQRNRGNRKHRELRKLSTRRR
jgi:predicted GNAT family N-acyltransferase